MVRSPKQSFGGEWTEEKLDCISKYLQAYTTALKKAPFCKLYIDAFAGTGYREMKGPGQADCPLYPELAGEEPVRFLEGSVRRALQVEPQFDSYVFIEKHRDKFLELSRLESEFPEHDIQVVNADANSYLQERIHDIDWRGTRAVLFLDPFGMEVDWSTLQSIASTEAIDLWYLFPLSAVIRMLPKDGSISDPWRRRLDLLFGTSEWYKEFYKPTSELTLFGTEETLLKQGNTEAISAFIVKRLESTFPAVAQNPLVLYNSGGTPLFLLCFAVSTTNPRGQEIALRIAHHILGKRKKHG